MNKAFNYPEFDITIIPFDNIFNNIQLNVLNSITLTTTKNNFNVFNSDCKKFFLHHLITETCKFIQTINNKNKILLVHPLFKNIHYEIWNYFDKDDIVKFTFDCFKQLKDYLPFPIYISDEQINLHIVNGELLEALNLIMEQYNSYKFKPITSKKLKEFSKKNGLTYLTNVYYISSEFKKLYYKQ